MDVRDIFGRIKERSLKEEGVFIAEGRYLLERLLLSRIRVNAVLCSTRMEGAVSPLVDGRCPLIVMRDDEIGQLVGFRFHRGVMAAGLRPPPLGMDRFLEKNPQARRIVICAGLDSDENLGSVMRTAAALGYDALVAGSVGADPWSRRCVRVSMGAGFTLPLLTADDGEDAAMRLRDHGFKIYGTVLAQGAQPLPAFRTTGKHALVFGNEAAGLDDSWRRRCDRELTIPIERNDSLNVGVAAGIFMYHLSLMPGE